MCDWIGVELKGDVLDSMIENTCLLFLLTVHNIHALCHLKTIISKEDHNNRSYSLLYCHLILQ